MRKRKVFQLLMAVFLVVLILPSCTGPAGGDPEVEKEAVKAVIEEEKAAFYAADLDRIAATWVDDNSGRKVVIKGDEIGETIGTDAILENDRAALAREIDGETQWDSDYLNYDIHVYGESALAYFVSRHRATTAEGSMETRFRRMVHLVKKDGKWKMDMMTLYLIEENTYPPLEESWFSRSLADKGTIVLQEDDYTVWGCSPIYDDEGKVHVFYSRIPKDGSWLVNSQIGHAVADHPEGPYEILGTIMEGRGEGYWDANSIHNPSVYRVDGKYVMLYIGNDTATAQRWLERAPEANSQRTGMAIADSPYGPWTRFDEPMIDVDPDSLAWDGYCTVNPGFVKHPNGEYWIYYRAWDRFNDDRRKTGVAFAKNLTGPYVKYEGNPIIDKFEGVDGQTEDPVMFYYKEKFHCVIRDMGNWDWLSSLYLESEDGLNWSYPKRAKHQGHTYYDMPEERRCERDQILLKDGVPEYIFNACSFSGGGRGGAIRITIEE